MLLDISSVLGRHIGPLDSSNIEDNMESLKFEVSVKVKLGYNHSAMMTCQSFELFNVMLNLLKAFPQVETFDKIKAANFVSMTDYFENYVQNFISMFGGGKEKIKNGHFLVPGCLKVRDLVFFVQEPIRLLLKKHEFRNCYMGLICQLTISSADMLIHCRELTLQCYSVMQSRYANDADNESFGRFLSKFSQLLYQCWGLIPPEMVVQTNIALANHKLRTRKAMNSLFFSFLNLIKSQYIPQIEKVACFQCSLYELGCRS